MSLSIKIAAIKYAFSSTATKEQLRKIPAVIIDHCSLKALFYLFSLGYIILSMHLPVSIYTDLVHDDALYWGNARLILGGHWLGEYNQLTLAKGSGFPLFLAVNALIGTPITLAITLFYLFACGLLANTLRVLGVNKYIVLILFFATLFHPYLFLIRITRENIYPALSLIIISGVIRLVFVPQQQDKLLKSVIPYGLVFGFFWVTREEGIWIVPALLVLVLLKILQLKQQNLFIKDIVLRFACFSLVAIAFVSFIGLINYHKYGLFEIVDFRDAAYTRTIKAIHSVDVGELPVSLEKRQAIYQVSSSFAQLKDFLENKDKEEASDDTGDSFVWTLREAIANKGYYQTPQRAAEFYDNISKEIEEACDSGAIKCKRNPPNSIMAQWQLLPEKIVDTINLAMVKLPIAATGGASQEPLDQLQRVRLFLGNPSTVFAPIEQRTLLSGWFYSTTPDWIVLNCSINKKTVKKVIDRIASPNVTESFKNPNANFQGFSIDVSDYDNCNIAIETSPSNILPINSLLEKQDTTLSLGEKGTFHIDHIYQSYVYNGKYVPFKVKSLLGKLYKSVMSVIVVLSILIYFIYFVFILFRKISITDIFIVSTMMWCLFISQILIIVFVDINYFPAINVTYMSATFPILCLATFLSLQLIFKTNRIAA